MIYKLLSDARSITGVLENFRKFMLGGSNSDERAQNILEAVTIFPDLESVVNINNEGSSKVVLTYFLYWQRQKLCVLKRSASITSIRFCAVECPAFSQSLVCHKY